MKLVLAEKPSVAQSIAKVLEANNRCDGYLEGKRETFRDGICAAIDVALAKNPKDFEELLKFLEQAGYECKRGKNVAVRGKGQKRFIRFRSLGEGYSQEEIMAVISGSAPHKSKSKKQPAQSNQKLNLILDIQEKMTRKGPGYQRWATVYNLKQMAKTLLFLRDHNVESIEELREKANASVERLSTLSDEIKSAEARIAEIYVLKKHIINYSKTRDVYVEYRNRISSEWLELLLDLDRREYNNNQTETRRHVSLNAMDQDDNQIPTEKDLFGEFYEEETWREMCKVLTERERLVGDLFFRQGYKQKEIAKIFEVNEARMSQIIRKIRKKLEKFA